MDEREPGTDYPTEESDGTATVVERETVETTERVETGGDAGDAGDEDSGSDAD